MLDANRVLLDLQQANDIAQSFSGCLEVQTIARCITEGLVERFQCAFARLWLLEPDQGMLRLIASSGLYTHTNGFFGRVPMGAYKVGKIAQNRMSFLSNNLPEEPWVGNREWAIANQIRGFAGYPLTIGDRVIGVLAMFSRHTLAPEFLEVLQTLCIVATIALDTAIQYQKQAQTWQLTASQSFTLALSDQLTKILPHARLTLLGTEQPLPLSRSYLFLRTAEILDQLHCSYARLLYSEEAVTLEAIAPPCSPPGHITSLLAEVSPLVAVLGGTLEHQPTPNQRALQLRLQVPCPPPHHGPGIQIHCTLPMLHIALTQLAIAAGLTLSDAPNAPLLTDDARLMTDDRPTIWVHHTICAPARVQARIDLSTSPEDLRQAVAAVMQGRTWGLQAAPHTGALSEREVEVLSLLAQGYRDRDIAEQLMISESTVKFHLTNGMTKLKARTRYQAIYQAIKQGWI